MFHLVKAENDYVTYSYNLLLLYTSLYVLTRIVLENKNNDEFEINEEGNWAIGIEEQPKVRADVYQKSYEYDERDRLLYARDNFSLYSIYRYDESGERSNKYNYFSEEETLYANRYFSTSINSFNRKYEGQSIKHIFLGSERLVTKTALNKINGLDQAYRDYEKSHTYYYHSDHLGSATLITDYKGKEYQRIEYTPYGESWIELSKNIDNYLPYRFTGKELDEETGFYYYGQRYLDPRYSIWHTSDPAIYDYMSQSKEGEGGIYNITNLNLYHYAGNNPVNYIDPDGRLIDSDRSEGEVFPDGMLDDINKGYQGAINNFSDLSKQLGDYLNSNDQNKSLSELIVNSALKWLGVNLNSDEAVSLLKNDFDTILSGLISHHYFKYNSSYTSDPRNEGAIAYVYNWNSIDFKDRTINFTENYSSVNLRENGNYTFSGVIVHEITHKVLMTNDYAYSVDYMLNLSDRRKYNNVNNWMYFYEAIYKGGML